MGILEFENSFNTHFEKTLISNIEEGDFTYGKVWSNAEHIVKNWINKGSKHGDGIAFILNNTATLLGIVYSIFYRLVC
tara:strand:- start:141 stop:374 length:234 start_codon:yes stop_codon:yes gene_type:complete